MIVLKLFGFNSLFNLIFIIYLLCLFKFCTKFESVTHVELYLPKFKMLEVLATHAKVYLYNLNFRNIDFSEFHLIFD